MKKVKIRYRVNSNGTSSIRLNYFHGYEIIDGKRKAKRTIKTLPFYLITKPKNSKEEKLNQSRKKQAVKIAEERAAAALADKEKFGDKNREMIFKMQSMQDEIRDKDF